MNICCITIGNEILLGKTINTNLAYIGSELTRIGLSLSSCLTIPDEPEAIRHALEEAWERSDVVLTTGGLGPTADDITKKEIAGFFQKKMIFSETLWDEVQSLFLKRGIQIPQINRNQAEIPEDFTALSNLYGTAPGLCYKEGRQYFFAMPGVPLEMKYLFSTHIIPILQKDFPKPAMLMKTIHTFGIAESAIAEMLADVIIPKNLNLAYLPQTGRVDLRIYGSNAAAFKQVDEILSGRLNPYIWGFDEEEPDKVLHEKMLKSGLSLSLAESCTGGLVQEMITRHPDSSRYFIGGVVSYQNEVKRDILGVSEEHLEKLGAVSEEVAIEMAQGVRNLLKADIGAAISGIAGPGGGTTDKPVGTVHVAVADKSTIKHALMHFNGDRDSIRRKSAEKCIFMILEMLKKGN